jgi:hypothetical protein
MTLVKKISITSGITIIMLIAFYTVWNIADQKNFCASCHEISVSVETSNYSSHRQIKCVECHGTALSNSWHSLKEKVGMLLTHFYENKKNEDIHLSEQQIIEMIDRCKNCHRTEYADWRSGGHSATYKQIFLDERHNKMEAPYWDCFRCHGIFYEGSIYDLMEPVNKKGPWKLKDIEREDMPTIPCLTCHEIHTKNETRKQVTNFKNPKAIFYEREVRNIYFGLYLRADKMFLRADKLGNPKIFDNGKELTASGEFTQNLCIQCHSPNYHHEAGTSDDRTPTGVHEGLSCNSCHSPHSNNAKNSCDKCHPAISNCGLDVKTMNTSFFSLDSPFNIHHVKCLDCHTKGIPVKKNN